MAMVHNLLQKTVWRDYEEEPPTFRGNFSANPNHPELNLSQRGLKFFQSWHNSVQLPLAGKLFKVFFFFFMQI